MAVSRSPEYQDDFVTLHVGDCLDVMRGMDESSIDAIVTDPPAGIGFMSRSWDHDRGGRNEWVAWMATIAAEALRVAKPGAHALVWALPRTSHWTATAWEDAGWQVRDRIGHLFGSGFPKSMNLPICSCGAGIDGPHEIDCTIYTMAEWRGWGTALKPAVEDWWLLRKPLGSTVSRCVQEHGTGALNIDGCRVGTEGACNHGSLPREDGYQKNDIYGKRRPTEAVDYGLGRWPANIVLSWPEDEYELRCDVRPELYDEVWRWLNENPER